MSLVNQMLQDLEARRAQAATTVASPLGGLAPSGNGGATKKINHALIGLSLVLAVVSAYLLLAPPKQRVEVVSRSEPQAVLTAIAAPLAAAVSVQAPEPAPEKVVAEPPKPVVVEVEVAKPVAVEVATPSQGTGEEIQAPTRLTGLQLRSLGQQSRILIDLDRQVAYRTKLEGRVLSVQLDGVSADALPTLVDADHLLQDFNAEPLEAGGVALHFSLEDNHRLRGAAISATVGGQRLAVELEADAPPPKSIAKQVRPLTDEQQAQQAFQRAVTLLGQGQQDRARQALEETLRLQPSHERARETLAALLLNSGRLSEAESGLAEGLQLHPESVALARLYARLVAERGDTATAITALERAMPAASADADFIALLAALYQRAGRHGEAAQSYRQLLALRSAGTAWMGLALSLEALGQPTEALDAYRQASRAGGLNPAVGKYVASRIAALEKAS